MQAIKSNGLFGNLFAGALCAASALILMAAPITDAHAEEVCTNTCQFASDGECDDGGEGSLNGLCQLGTDCDDCGTRTAEPVVPGCSNTCQFSNDGECDDGGPGSLNGLCSYGTDCGDCGQRDPDAAPEATSCTNTCQFASDGECDDGGPGSLNGLCQLGTDCDDCGSR